MKRVTAIVLAAGKGLRFKSKIPKPLAQVNAKPLVIYALEVLGNHPDIAEIILVANQDNLKVIENKIRQHRIRKIDKIVLGGKRRQDSVRNALGFINPDRELVLIHDAVRPLINRQIVSRVIKEARKSKAAIVLR
jgi:2-C-methyl-D-erythritol 4-phosphate cytidylyltransferase